MTTRYRADIDGLRAVAVTAVVLFHAGTGLAGGFVGVDVFFVISGYLITGILFVELAETGRISLVGFYARRFARILPSLVLVTAAVMAMGSFVMVHTLYGINSLAKSAVAALLFVANLYSYDVTDDYFAAAASQLPLLHTWSLGVEEQYYMVWPLLLLAAGRLAPANLRRSCLVAIGLVTAGWAAYCAIVNTPSPSLAFYSPLSRFWELGLGSALALAEPRLTGRPKAELPGAAASCAGVVLMAAAVVVTREGAAFPWPSGLLATGGTALVIAGNGVAPGNPVSRFLALRPMVAVGKVSYAWYLWHWPALAFADILNVGAPPLFERVLLMLAALALAFVTVAIYENPVRRRARRLPRLRVIAGGGAALACTVLATSALYAAAKLGYPAPDARLTVTFADASPRQLQCLHDATGPELTAQCVAPTGRPRVVLWDDSHADQWAPALQAWSAQPGGWPVEQLTRAACPPVLGVTPQSLHGGSDRHCAQYNASAFSRIDSGAEPQIVVVAADWAGRLQSTWPDAPVRFIDVHVTSTEEARELLERRLDETLARIPGRIPVIVVLQSPVFARMPAECVQRKGALRCGLSDAERKAETRAANAVLATVASHHANVALLDPAEILCPTGPCPEVIDGHIAYYDKNHVAASAAVSARSQAVWDRALRRAAGEARLARPG